MLVSALITWCNKNYERDAVAGSETISDDDWIMYFNDAQSDISSFLKFPETSITDLVDDTTTYGLPSDFLELQSAWEKTSGSYVQMGSTNRHKMPSQTSEKRFTLWEDNIILSFTPSETTTDGLQLYYYKRLADITATTGTIGIKDPYALGYYALSITEASDRAIGQSGYYYQMYMQRKDNLKVNPKRIRNGMWS